MGRHEADELVLWRVVDSPPELLDCASPLALPAILDCPKAVEDYRSPRLLPRNGKLTCRLLRNEYGTPRIIARRRT
jgi:hypothetical protein